MHASEIGTDAQYLTFAEIHQNRHKKMHLADIGLSWSQFGIIQRNAL